MPYVETISTVGHIDSLGIRDSKVNSQNLIGFRYRTQVQGVFQFSSSELKDFTFGTC